MRVFRDHNSAAILARLLLCGVALSVVASCSREDEAVLRSRLDQWFSLGETLAFHASPDCAAGAYRLVDTQLKSALPVVGSSPEVARALPRRGVVALDNPDQAPDAAMVELANSDDRPLGMGMRRAGLEGRACMDDLTESAFRYALANPQSVLAFDGENGAVMLLDPATRVLVVAMGSA